jgi:hypothetical protein
MANQTCVGQAALLQYTYFAVFLALFEVEVVLALFVIEETLGPS